jgi:multiple sugar transport system permease protein
MGLALMGFLTFQAGPIGASAYLSLTDYKLLGAPNFLGLGNFGRMLADPLFWQSLRVTVSYAVVTVPAQLALGLVVALLMNQSVKGIAVFRTIYYLPAVITGVAVAVLWRWILNPEFGVVNAVLSYIGITGPKWLSDPQWALRSLMLMSLWSVGGSMVLNLAALQGIPTELYEAVEIDGGGMWTKFTHITTAMISPVLFFNLVTGIIGTFQEFTRVYVMTRGGPVNSTLFYGLYLYQNAFAYLDMGYASSLAWTLLLIILALTLVVFRTSRLWVYYEGSAERA